ncbi:DUF952 domain-containing protein [Kiloniella laminariae]|uniref:DUF952 domain-containing protein n=1 Tax=Kiloniella laminariae TaxID=454162 RepID=A0ABT4LMU0_9PROT|nr:DUF952 domain-containing protein [Kiloniella laminariae]MCZ4282210.1 DUF952 domain-containing protein [Kiloniella laminariae]
MAERWIYHVCKATEWKEANKAGVYPGSSQDQADGFIHFSSGKQLQVSVAKHRAGQDDLVLLEVDGALLGQKLIWEKSRGGQLFPHLYGELPLTAVRRNGAVRLGEDGKHLLPDWFDLC